MNKTFKLCKQTVVIITSVCAMTSFAIAASHPGPTPIYGSYIRHLDRSQQTFNGKSSPTDLPTKQKEDFFTVCKDKACVAYTPNLRAPVGAPKYMEYHWNNNRWELKADILFNCNDKSKTKVKSTLFESLKSNGDGSFSGERSLKIQGAGCPEEGQGEYKLPFKLTPA